MHGSLETFTFVVPANQENMTNEVLNDNIVLVRTWRLKLYGVVLWERLQLVLVESITVGEHLFEGCEINLGTSTRHEGSFVHIHC